MHDETDRIPSPKPAADSSTPAPKGAGSAAAHMLKALGIQREKARKAVRELNIYRGYQSVDFLFDRWEERIPVYVEQLVKAQTQDERQRILSDMDQFTFTAAMATCGIRKGWDDHDWVPHAIRADGALKRSNPGEALSVDQRATAVAQRLASQGIVGLGQKKKADPPKPLTAETIRRELLRAGGYKKLY